MNIFSFTDFLQKAILNHKVPSGVVYQIKVIILNFIVIQNLSIPILIILTLILIFARIYFDVMKIIMSCGNKSLFSMFKIWQ